MKYLIPRISLLILVSCNKDKLIGDSSMLIGEWEWYFTHRSSFCGSGPSNEFIYDDSVGYTHTIKFTKRERFISSQMEKLLKSIEYL
ncbi:hypothetical protein JYT74_03785 [Crocinitomix catalasitica]|nr:hypothetical protein [Crocinitomix catalasitica]